MIAHFAQHTRLHARPGRRDALIAKFLDAADLPRDNPASQLSLVSSSPDDADVVFLTEVWTSAEEQGARATVKRSRHGRRTCPRSAPARRRTMWRHENLNEDTHEWLKRECADVPLTLFKQILACVEAGHPISVEDRPELPESFVAGPAQTDARFSFLAGEMNNCFLPESQHRTHEWFERHAPGRHSAYFFPGYGHLDISMGQRADEDIFPVIVSELEKGAAE